MWRIYPYILCSNFKGEANPDTTNAADAKTQTIARLKGAFGYCDGVYSGFTDAHLNDRADFFGAKTNKMFILTQVGNHDALHYGNLVTYLRINGLVLVRGLVLMAEKRARVPTTRFRIGRAGFFWCVARSSAKPAQHPRGLLRGCVVPISCPPDRLSGFR